ncbi:MAG: hypothetical protein NUW37_04915 [Planctomycetes bacterium]|nr:hypothetical protein [Planctomycetota bacterium]
MKSLSRLLTPGLLTALILVSSFSVASSQTTAPEEPRTEDEGDESTLTPVEETRQDDVLSRIDRGIARIEDFNSNYRGRVDALIDDSVEELRRTQDLFYSVENEAHDFLEALRAVNMTLRELMALDQQDVNSLIDDLVVSLLGDQLKILLEGLGLPEDQHRQALSFLENQFIPALSDMLKGMAGLMYRSPAIDPGAPGR